MERIRITSRANEAVKRAAALREKKARDEQGRFAAEGETLLREALEAGVLPLEVFAADRAAGRAEAVLAGREESPVRLSLLPDEVFEKITTEKASDGIVSVFSADGLPRLSLEKEGFYLVLENLQDPGNTGTCLRCAAAFGAEGVLLVGGADRKSPKAARASMGALFRVPVREAASSGEALDALAAAGIGSVAMALSDRAEPLDRIAFPRKAAFWIGNEGNGLSDEVLARAEKIAVIPMVRAESLNAGVCAGVVAWEAARRRSET